MDRVEARLHSQGVFNLTVAVMAENDSAIRFYRRRGLIPGELVLYRIDAPYGRCSS
jgi:ribosomal protein S18 acetylase RimI-like enzyme